MVSVGSGAGEQGALIQSTVVVGVTLLALADLLLVEPPEKVLTPGVVAGGT